MEKRTEEEERGGQREEEEEELDGEQRGEGREGRWVAFVH